jgi:competence protein ComEC
VNRFSISGVAFLFGVWSLGWWTPQTMTTLFGVLSLSGLGLVIRDKSLSDPCLVLSSFFLGCSLGLSFTPDECGESFVRGPVLSRSGRSALVQGECGRLELFFSEKIPARGDVIAAHIQPFSPKAILMGEPSELRRRRRIRCKTARVLQWTSISNRAERAFPEVYKKYKYGGLLWAFATGERQKVPKEIKRLLRDTGTNHLLAISGMHIGLVSGMVFWLVRWMMFPLILRNLAWPALIIPRVVAVGVAISYGTAVHWPASAQRSVIMVGLISLATCFGRKVPIQNCLVLAAVIIVMVEPAELSSLGFLMSFGAVFGMILIGPRFDRLLPPDTPKGIRFIVQSLGATCGATLGTLPITAWYFQELAPISPVANLVATPFIVLVAVPCGLLGCVFPSPLDELVLSIGDMAIGASLWILEAIRGPMWHPAVDVMGAIFIVWALAFRKKVWVMALLLFSALWKNPVPPSALEIIFLNVGQGDASIVEWPNGERWLVDGGPNKDTILRYLRRRGIDKLDVLVASHPHLDHINGLFALEDEIQISNIWVPQKEDVGGSDWFEWLKRQEMKGTKIYLPDEIDKAGVQVLHPMEGWRSDGDNRSNEESLVFELRHSGTRILWTGDIENKAEQAILEKINPIDILKVPHHGSRTSSSVDFIQKLDPKVSIISCGKFNRFSHPNNAVLWRLRGSRVLRTDQLGSIKAKITVEGVFMSAWQDGMGWKTLDF